MSILGKSAFDDTGILKAAREKVISHILRGISVEDHIRTYSIATNDLSYAEPEFSGKYLDICSALYQKTGEIGYLNHAEKVYQSIADNQRADGYLGCLPEGYESEKFSIWNEAFTILGLVHYAEASTNKTALKTAEKCADFLMKPFISGKKDILDATNKGTQNISILYMFCKLYETTKNEKIKSYIFFIVDAIKHSDLNYCNFESIFDLRSQKGIESLVVLIGILEYAVLFFDQKAIDSVDNYWDQVWKTQIRNTGNGTIKESWIPNGNQAAFLEKDERPNETCVAVGWIELSVMLFSIRPQKKYLDAIDLSLYNHILASLSEDGSDFAYYQPNVGQRVVKTNPDMYKCCRYRGFTLFTYLDNMLFYEDDNKIIPIIYSSSHYCSEDMVLHLKTNYPYDPVIFINGLFQKSKKLLLRIPEHCHLISVLINGKNLTPSYSDGFLCFEPECNEHFDIVLNMENILYFEKGIIDGNVYVAVHCGCLLMSSDVNNIILTPSDTLHIAEKNGSANLRVAAGNHLFTDYASAVNFNIWNRYQEVFSYD